MKHILFTIIMLVALSFSASAQWINGLSVVPSNPTATDNVSIIANLDFPSGDCAEKTLTTSIAGTQINLSALHCVGPLAYICGATDTFQLGQLTVGTYTLYLQVEMGSQPFPCTPGIMPGVEDSLTFTVTTGTGLPVVSKSNIALFPNPGQKGFTIRFGGSTMPLVRVVDLQGRVVREYPSVATDTFIDLSDVKSGAYIVEVYESGNLIATEKWVRN